MQLNKHPNRMLSNLIVFVIGILVAVLLLAQKRKESFVGRPTMGPGRGPGHIGGGMPRPPPSGAGPLPPMGHGSRPPMGGHPPLGPWGRPTRPGSWRQWGGGGGGGWWPYWVVPSWYVMRPDCLLTGCRSDEVCVPTEYGNLCAKL
jgi:hypothetical protein